jgi:cytochrome c2
MNPTPTRRLAVAALILATLLLAGCAAAIAALPGASAAEVRSPIAGASVARGRDLMTAYGCHTCHTIPGVPNARALVGPPLNGWADRIYIAGALVNSPDNLMRWLREPQAIEPGTAMPNMGVTEEDARDLAAYLYTLRGPVD